MKKSIVYAAAALFLGAVLYGCAGMDAHGGVRPAPAFKVTAVSGGHGSDSFTLEEFRGKPLVLNIGAIWCPHCLHELEAFTTAQKKYGSSVNILMVFIKSERGAIDEVQSEKKLPFGIGHDPTSEIGRAYGVKGIPVTLFIDSAGNITDEYLGGISEDRLTQKIEELMARSASAAHK